VSDDVCCDPIRISDSNIRYWSEPPDGPFPHVVNNISGTLEFFCGNASDKSDGKDGQDRIGGTKNLMASGDW
jgi:hypothetical protein